MSRSFAWTQEGLKVDDTRVLRFAVVFSGTDVPAMDFFGFVFFFSKFWSVIIGRSRGNYSRPIMLGPWTFTAHL